MENKHNTMQNTKRSTNDAVVRASASSIFYFPLSISLFLLFSIFHFPFSAPLSVAATIGKISLPINNLGLTSYWTFNGNDMSDGKFVEQLGTGYTGRPQNIATTSFYVSGKVGQGVYFDGNNDEVYTGVAMSNFITNSEGTVSVWMKPEAINASQSDAWYLPTVWADDNGAQGSYLGISHGTIGGNDRIWAAHVEGPTCCTEDRVGVSYTPGEWVHIVWMHSGGNLYIYKNGELGGSVASGVTHPQAMVDFLRFGRNYNETAAYRGSLDEVRTYNRALSQSEIASLYSMGEARTAKTPTLVEEGLVGWWTLDGVDIDWGTNQVTDKSGNGNTGFLLNTSTTSTPVNGIVGQAFEFEGAGDVQQLLVNSAVNGSVPVTVSAWVKVDDLTQSGNVYMIGIPSDSDTYRALQYNTGSGTYIYAIRHNTGNQDATGYVWAQATLNDTDWHHMVTVSEANNDHRIYIDGVLAERDTKTSAPTGLTRFAVGYSVDSTPFQPIKGLIDDVRVYDRTLSLEEIQTLYTGTSPSLFSSTRTPKGSLQSGLVGHWSFDGPTVNWNTNQITDQSGNGYIGTIVNMATATAPVSGVMGQALSFDTSDTSRVVVESNLGLSSQVSFSLWAKLTASTSNRTLVSVGRGSSGAQDSVYLQVGSTGNLYLAKFVSSAFSELGGYPPPTGEWNHLVGTFDSSTGDAVLYINASSTAGTITASFPGTLKRTAIGSLVRSSDVFIEHTDGEIDDVRIYDRVLSQDEVTQLYNLGR